jgi:cytidylate kinase
VIVTIDGPAGSGKSTVALALAQKIKFLYIDSGSLYRAFGWWILNNKTKKNLQQIIKNIEIDYKYKSNKAYVFVNGKDVTKFIRTPEISAITTKIASKKIVRAFVTNIQYKIAKSKNIVIEGRDAGSKVFPNAQYKFYIYASAKERARRRYEELKQKGLDVKFNDIYKSVVDRDKCDSERKHSPLIKPKNSIIINTTNMTINQVVAKIKTYIG